MGAVVTVIIIVAGMLLGKYLLEHDNDDIWRGY